MKLNVGCGKDIRPEKEGWINLDCIKLPGVNIVHDIKNRFPFLDNAFDYVLCQHVVEHVSFDYKLDLITELWRITKEGGIIEIAVPTWNDRNAWRDPTHKSVWEPQTFSYFIPGHWGNYYSPARFRVKVNELRGGRKEETHWILEVLK